MNDDDEPLRTGRSSGMQKCGDDMHGRFEKFKILRMVSILLEFKISVGTSRDRYYSSADRQVR